jgi:hypothetical protein
MIFTFPSPIDLTKIEQFINYGFSAADKIPLWGLTDHNNQPAKIGGLI